MFNYVIVGYEVDDVLTLELMSLNDNYISSDCKKILFLEGQFQRNIFYADNDEEALIYLKHLYEMFIEFNRWKTVIITSSIKNFPFRQVSGKEKNEENELYN